MSKSRYHQISRLVVLLAAVLMPSWAFCQTILFSQYDHGFRVVGIATNGAIVVLAETREDNAVVYEFTGTNAHITPLHHLDSAGNGDVARMSRDGEWITGQAEIDETRIPTLWRRSRPEEIIIAEPPPGAGSLPRDVTSTPNGPLAVCEGFPSSFIWTLDQGLFPWVTNHQPFLSRLTIYRLSRDGETFAGYDDVIRYEGNPIVRRALVGTRTNYTYLSPRSSTNSGAFAISPNGRFISGYDNLHAVLWQGGKMKHLPFGKQSLSHSDTVTDNGFAGGRGEDGEMIYDPRSRKAYGFTNWWAKRYPQTPLPGRVRRINDLYEHRGNIYCLLLMRDDELEENFSILAIAPIKGLPLACVKNLKGCFARIRGIPGLRVDP